MCGRQLTLGVLHRVNEVSGRRVVNEWEPDADGFIRGDGEGPPYARLIPLREIIAAVKGVGVNTRTVMRAYSAITDAVGSELAALLWASSSDLEAVTEGPVADAILQARTGQVQVTPGFDGQYGTVSLPGR